MIEWLVNKKMFRNANHAIWFLASIGFLLVMLAQNLFADQRLMLIAIPAVVHFPPFITSIASIYVQKRDSEIYSKDCIWFNAILILLYVFLYFYL